MIVITRSMNLITYAINLWPFLARLRGGKEEWLALINYLGGESFAGSKLKESGYEHWDNPNIGATNTTGFTALPGGYREADGTYNEIGNICHFWSSTENGNSFAWFTSMGANFSQIYFYNGLKAEGRSVRCVKD